ncbi:MAG TPA: hypothetical protein ENJ13_07510 [Chromatiales bacterium]|nr:hypothetical protein [Chromatiales bacterium]
MNIKRRYQIIRSLIAVVALSWSATAIADSDDTVYYAQHSFYVYKNKHVTTNYHTGILVPINSPVKIDDMGRKKIKIELPSLGDIKVTVVNAKKHTQKNMQEIKERMFGPNKVDISKSSKKVQEAIMNGQVIVGMTKAETILAYGYPPTHVTPTTDLNQWTYWVNRWNRIVVNFEDDKIKEIID